MLLNKVDDKTFYVQLGKAHSRKFQRQISALINLWYSDLPRFAKLIEVLDVPTKGLRITDVAYYVIGALVDRCEAEIVNDKFFVHVPDGEFEVVFVDGSRVFLLPEGYYVGKLPSKSNS